MLANADKIGGSVLKLGGFPAADTCPGMAVLRFAEKWGVSPMKFALRASCHVAQGMHEVLIALFRKRVHGCLKKQCLRVVPGGGAGVVWLIEG